MAEADILARFRPKGDVGTAPSDPEGAIDDHVAFGWLRGLRDRAIALELRRRNGNITALPYAYLQKIEFNPSQGLFLTFAGDRFKIEGRNLNAEVKPGVKLFEGLCRHKVTFIQESPQLDQFSDDDRLVVIDSITP
ncbi:hypothetical protein Pan44_19020 [Caulifigura coniformis]|uniref:Uncharacterized protein n=1 Tax=Caulifigura coniformis TaxID=2527983 RepID=A0A517SCQ0_9PLAN|nr:hypothetical protein [Caulifigura coniformis]QDT53876.1 hypothetical protein Pan44_19020 [Caulifigura coniformis]